MKYHQPKNQSSKRSANSSSVAPARANNALSPTILNLCHANIYMELAYANTVPHASQLITRFSHDRLKEDQLWKFIEDNEPFLCTVYMEKGLTNLGPLFLHYLNVKKQKQEAAMYANTTLPPSLCTNDNMGMLNKQHHTRNTQDIWLCLC
jgi:hypothetical protein